jgi:DNA-binding NtrC family response regulator
MENKKRILILDENDISAREFFLKEVGNYKVDVAKKASDAEKLMKENSYDTLIVEPIERDNFHNPNYSNPNFLIIKKFKEKNIPVVICTGSEERLKRKYNMNPKDYSAFFGKPCDDNELCSVLEEILKSTN